MFSPSCTYTSTCANVPGSKLHSDSDVLIVTFYRGIICLKMHEDCVPLLVMNSCFRLFFYHREKDMICKIQHLASMRNAWNEGVIVIMKCRVMHQHGCSAPAAYTHLAAPKCSHTKSEERPAWGQRRKTGEWGTAFLQMNYYQVFMVSARTSPLRQAVTNGSHNNPSPLLPLDPTREPLERKQSINLEENTHTDTVWGHTQEVCVSLGTHTHTKGNPS